MLFGWKLRFLEQSTLRFSATAYTSATEKEKRHAKVLSQCVTLTMILHELIQLPGPVACSVIGGAAYSVNLNIEAFTPYLFGL